ncbi:hypothetical protein LOTGIDRAFT_122739, partial [Lottia gigantea]
MHGVKTVQVSRGKSGYGFTISGQHPCVLSCIVSGSPAEVMGLKPGDYVMSVNGENVSRSSHDSVVRMVGLSTGTLELQVAENLNDSDSSEEEYHPRVKSRFPNRSCRSISHHSNPNLYNNICDRNVGRGSVHHRERLYEDMTSGHLPMNIPAGHLPSDSLNSDNSEHSANFHEHSDVKAVVGYIGSIEMPSDATRPHQRLQSLRNAVRRLRKEKRIHTFVLMDVQNDGVKLTNMAGKIITQYPADRLAFSGVCPDDKRFFGIVTLHDQCDDISEYSNKNDNIGTTSSCHIFMVDPELRSHNAHSTKAQSFGFQCTIDPDNLSCQEFPRSCTHIILAVTNLYKGRQGENYENDIVQSQAFANPTRHPHRSSSNSSNSDSGLGFGREDNSNDRVFVVDMPAGESASTRPNAIGGSRGG